MWGNSSWFFYRMDHKRSNVPSCHAQQHQTHMDSIFMVCTSKTNTFAFDLFHCALCNALYRPMVYQHVNVMLCFIFSLYFGNLGQNSLLFSSCWRTTSSLLWKMSWRISKRFCVTITQNAWRVSWTIRMFWRVRMKNKGWAVERHSWRSLCMSWEEWSSRSWLTACRAVRGFKLLD